MSKLSADLVHRFGDHVEAEAPDAHAAAVFECMARRGSCRRFKPDPVSQALIETLCALALASPSKSDLQQRDIVIIQDAAIRSRINELLADQEWISVVSRDTYGQPRELEVDEHLQDRLRRAIAALDSDDASLFLLRHVEGLSNDELAGLFAMEKNNVAVKLHRIRHRLQAEMER